MLNKRTKPELQRNASSSKKRQESGLTIFETERPVSDLYYSRVQNIGPPNSKLLQKVFSITLSNHQIHEISSLSDEAVYKQIDYFIENRENFIKKKQTLPRLKPENAIKRENLKNRQRLAVFMTLNKYSIDYVIAETHLKKKVITELVRRYKKYGCIESCKKYHRLKWSFEHYHYLKKMMEIKGNWLCTASELAAKLQKKFKVKKNFFTESSLKNYLQRLKVSHKKAYSTAAGAFTKSTAQKRKEYINKFYMHEREGYKMIFIDESSIITSMCPKKGWFKKGRQHQLKLNACGKSERLTIIGAVSSSGIEGFMYCDFGAKTKTFTYFMIKLVERLESTGENLSKVVFILDNCPIHRSMFFRDNLATKLNILYLPPYSPFLNPIELFWSNWKKKLFRTQHATKKELIEAATEVGLSFGKKYFNNNYYKSFDFHKDCMELNQNIYLKTGLKDEAS